MNKRIVNWALAVLLVMLLPSVAIASTLAFVSGADTTITLGVCGLTREYELETIRIAGVLTVSFLGTN